MVAPATSGVVATSGVAKRSYLGANEFSSLHAAYAAVQACAVAVGCVLIKAGYLSTQLKPCKIVDTPFDPTDMVDGYYPQLTWKLKCDRRHIAAYEHERNLNGHCNIAPAHRRPRSDNKGAPTLATRHVANRRACSLWVQDDFHLVD
jgi:hypothetical protein